ncbi:beta-glucosidase [Lachnospiraceae bacterium C7]|nr:beta-glucosidase [Lachnospiraceae bacterium C7]
MKHQNIVSKMTLEEKAAFLSGAGEWQTREIKSQNIPAIFCSDGPHGVRKQAGAGDHLGLNESLKATCFPTAATIANSWDEKLGEEIGEALGEEAMALDVNVLLGPGLNIKRSPLCGRNFEYFSEDPYLAGKMAASYVKGIQSQGVYACPKHYAVNSQELRRMAMNAVVDERTLREIYLTGFEIAVKEGNAKTIMSAYNEVNGTYANENKHLLQDILRDEWGFDGIVITDWGASNDHVKGVEAGSNLEMPNPGLDSAREIVTAVENKTLSEKDLDNRVDELLDAVLTLSASAKAKKDVAAKGNFDVKKHHEIARKAAAKSCVLLKNDDRILPLKKNTKVAIIGDFATTPRYQGAGSSLVNPTQVETVSDVIKDYDLDIVGVEEGYERNGEESQEKLEKAVQLAKKADVVLFFFGLNEISESEGLDRNHMKIPANQIKVIEEISKQNSQLVGIISAGSTMEMPWEAKFKGLLNGYLNGQAGAGAICDILTGKVNPSGKLNETVVIKYEDTPAYEYYPSQQRDSEYKESIYVGYRYYDKANTPVLYPFGYGLSYTEFEYSNIAVDKTKVTFDITNVGDVDGEEIPQLYVGMKDSKIFRAKKELKGFKKVFIKAGETKTVSIEFDDKTFRYWNVLTNKFEIEEGTYQIYVGSNVRDIALRGELQIEGTTDLMPYKKAELPSYFAGNIKNVSDTEFEKLYGKKLPKNTWSGTLTRNDAICQMYYAKSGLARLVYKILTKKKEKSEKIGKPDLNILFIYNMPFRALAKMTAGMISMEMVDGILLIVNGHFFKGAGKTIKGFFKNRKLNKKYEEKL